MAKSKRFKKMDRNKMDLRAGILLGHRITRTFVIFFVGPDRFVVCLVLPVSSRWIYCYN